MIHVQYSLIIFGEECLGFLDERKQAKMKWVQDPS